MIETATAPSTRARVLIVEDEFLVAEDIRDTLARLGYDVDDVVPSGEAALKAVERYRPDLALMDIRLRGRMDGIETASVLRQRYDVPVVYLTAHSDAATLQRAERTEPFGYVIKPFQEKEIRATVAMALYRSGMERRLRESEELHRLLVNHVPALICRVDADGRYTFVNSAHERWFGRPVQQVVGARVVDVLGPAVFSEVEKPLARALTGQVVTFDLRLADGRQVQVTFVPGGESGQPSVYGVLIDVTARRQLEQALSKEKDRLFATLCCIGDGVVAVDRDCRVEFMNYVSERLTGWSSQEAQGMPAAEVLRFVDERSREPLAVFGAALDRGETVGLPARTLLLSRNGNEYPVEDSLAPVRDSARDVTGAVIVFRDVTEERRIRSQIEEQARRDALTGLVNRSEFELEAQRLLDEALDRDHVHSLIYLDLDQFKVVNDTCGHAGGDELLRQVAQLMEQRLRKTDTIARLGGDEFGILMRDCSPTRATEIVQGLIDALTAFRFPWQEKTFCIGASAGIAPLDRTTDSLKEALVNADTACYIAKEKGRGRTQIFEEGNAVFAGRREQTTWVSRIVNALEVDAFRLYEQEIVPLTGDAPAGQSVELLVRLVAADGGIVPPGAFLPAAERYGLVLRLDRWVIQHAFGQIARRARGRVYSVNLSGASLNDDGLLGFILGMAERTGVDLAQVVFEITETVAVSNMVQTRKLMAGLKAVGCRFALDDFGRGVSSFNYLKELPVEFLKIDGNLVRGIARDAVNRVMVEAINRVGHAMGIATVAECVEDEETLELLHQLRVDYAQGFHLSAPGPMKE